jgi:hypothetical protein
VTHPTPPWPTPREYKLTDWGFDTMAVGDAFSVPDTKRHAVSSNVCRRNKRGGAQYALRRDEHGAMWCYRIA